MSNGDIDIWFGTPGVGKTKKRFQDWEDVTGKKWYFTNSHKLLSEQEERMNGWLHIWGLRKICPCLQAGKFYNKKIAKLANKYPELPNEYLCKLCKVLEAFDQKKCPYHLQKKELDHAKQVMSPIQYLSTGWFRDFKAKHIAVDDCMMQKRKHPTHKTLAHAYRFFWYAFYKNKPMMTFEQFLKDDENFDEFMEKWKDIHAEQLKAITKMEVKDESVGRIPIIAIPPEELEVYRKYYRKHGHPSVRFATPYFFYLFDYVVDNKKKVHLTIIDAYPNRMFLNGLRTRYEKENFKSIYFNWKEIKFSRFGMGHQIQLTWVIYLGDHRCYPLYHVLVLTVRRHNAGLPKQFEFFDLITLRNVLSVG